MIISHKHRYIFVRPRKVASGSVQISLSRSCGHEDVISGGEVFRPGVDTDNFGVMSEKNTEAFTDTVDQLHGHYLPGTIREKVGTDIWNEYFKFTTIRNPWDLIVSFLHWKFGPNWPDIPGSNLLRVRSLRDVRRSLLRRQARRGFISGHPRKSVELVLKTEMFP